MTAKEYLNQAYRLDRQAEMLIAKAEKLRSSLYGKGVSYDGSKVKGAPCGDLSDTVAQVIEYEQQSADVIEKLIGKRIEIERVIAAVPDADQREVLKMPTHNSITKAAMLKVIAWLWDMVFEWEDGEE